jgi:hypothetical protein
VEEKWPQELTTIPQNVSISGYIRITRKDFTILEFIFFEDNQSSKILKLMKSSTLIDKIEKVFAFKFRNSETFNEETIASGWNVYDIKEEYLNRQKISKDWEISRINEKFELCSTYPRLLVLPKNADKKTLFSSSHFRSQGRIPVLSWIHPLNQASLTRSSQPCPGISRSRSKEDELLIELLRNGEKKLYIIDCRPKTNAMANTVT